MPVNPKVTKRQRELSRQQRQRNKAAKREQRRIEKVDRGKHPHEPGEDPDLAGIVPGPQPPLF